MSALALASFSVASITGLNLNYRKCCWVQYGTEGRDSLQTWISKKCNEFREMQIVKHATCVGTMIVPDGHLHRWTAHRGKFIQRVLKINASSRSLVERLCDFKIYANSVLCFVGSICAQLRKPSWLRTMLFSVLQQTRITLLHLRLLGLTPFVAMAQIWWALIPSAPRLAIELRHCR